jgi:hypothetical protein
MIGLVARRAVHGRRSQLPVAVDMKFRGMTLDQYDQILGKMGLRQGGDMPPGGISHWVAETDDGVHIVDVWESRETFDKFAEEQIGPYSREVGITEQPEITFSEVHNYLTA